MVNFDADVSDVGVNKSVLTSLTRRLPPEQDPLQKPARSRVDLRQKVFPAGDELQCGQEET